MASIGTGARVRTLANGLTVIVESDSSSPIGTFWIWYRVGGRNERPGITGVSHWVEHMLFKGTERFGPGEIFRQVEANGGGLNGFTWLDYTAYYETLPIQNIDLALAIESDRMANARFDPEEVASERTVIISERQGSENSPYFRFNEKLTRLAITEHPYRGGVIGSLEDLQTISREDLFGHYQHFYVPNNAVAVFVGALPEDEAFRRIEAAFGAIPAGNVPDQQMLDEPRQTEERRLELELPAPNRLVNVIYPSVRAKDSDAPVMLVLDSLLSGTKSLGMGGTSFVRSSRLYKALVSTGLAISAGSSFTWTIDPLFFGVSAVLQPGADHTVVEAVIENEVGRLRTELVGTQELDRVKRQLQAQFTYARQSVSSRAYLLGQLAIVAPGVSPQQLLDAALSVSSDDVQRVAQEYLNPEQRTTGVLIPSVAADTGAPPMSVAAPEAGISGASGQAAIDPSMPVVRETPTENGARVITLGEGSAQADRPAVIKLRLPTGANADRDLPGLAMLAADVANRGAGARNFEQLADYLDDKAASIGVSVGRSHIDFSLLCLRADVDDVFGVLVDTLRNPRMDDEQINLVRARMLAGLRHAAQDTRSVAGETLDDLLFPPGHPYRQRLSGTEESVAALDREALLAFAQRAFQPVGALLGVDGAIGHADGLALWNRHLGDWSGSGSETADAPAPGELKPGQREERGLPNKTQSDIAIGLFGPARATREYRVLSVANMILGQQALMGRIGHKVREELGLAYYAGSRLSASRNFGTWRVSAGVAPQNVDLAIDSILAETRRFVDEGPTEAELADAQTFMIGSLPLGLETPSARIERALDIVTYGLGNDYLQHYADFARSLTVPDVRDEARRWLDPDEVAIAVAGPE